MLSMPPMRMLTAAALSLLASAMAAGAAGAPFDGRWSVLVLTQSGPCDPGYRYEVNVSQGKVIYAGDAAIGMQGTVTPSGQVKVSVGQGGQHASGSGHLSANAGSGTWRGGASNRQCSGRWEAERR
jgi:hypothetical protein